MLAIAGLFVILLLVIIGLAAQQSSPTAVTTQSPNKGTINNPAKVGEAVKVRAYGRSFEITVLDFIRGEEAYNKIKLANIYISNPSPDPGNEFILVKVRVSYIEGDGTASIGKINFKPIVSSVVYDPPLYSYLIAYPDDMPELKSVELIPGGNVEGWILFEVPADSEVLISFSYLFSGPLCYIKLEKRGFA